MHTFFVAEWNLLLYHVLKQYKLYKSKISTRIENPDTFAKVKCNLIQHTSIEKIIYLGQCHGRVYVICISVYVQCIKKRTSHHRVDSVIESSLREIIGSKNFALINLSLNLCETTIYDKVFLENLFAVP